ncbi:class I SAM-dependent DNA methyltransferase [Microbaculum sp. FT89]|uniref:class I SAM-dependent DNA methyltransferase n=1 Tax=Microbaculum sp. FT89 TaxID=3447298 RepID=UPI003F52DEE1
MAVSYTNPSSMRLSWNEIRVRAATFAEEWKDARYEKGETQTFYNEFFEIFGVTRRRVASFEEPVKKLEARYGFIDLFWKGVLLVEQKSAGRDLTKAKTQAFDYFPWLKESDLPRFVLVSDFQTFELYDLDEGTEFHFTLAELPDHIEAFGFVIGVQKRTFRDQDPVNIAASELMGRLHDALKDSGYTGHDLERFLVRLLFCLFGDDTGIFEPRDIFLELITERTREDGSDLGAWLSSLFEVLNTPIEKRQRKLDEDLARFPYVNGELFDERLRIPAFDSDMRKLLIEACEFSWDAISPAIFGSLFQSVMEPDERRAQGAHYTTEKNILKVIEPLFLDELRAEFERLKARRDTGRANALERFHERLGALTFFDPACGCGNFLIISYRELRTLEIELLHELNPRGQRVLDVTTLSRINVDQFYGIEIGEFPARIAEVALWMMDHIMNNRLSLEFGEVFARIPLRVSPHIHCADALEMDWTTVLPPEHCSYILGNPPFIGAKYQTNEQREQVRRIAALGKSGGTLDYVTAWFITAGSYIVNDETRIGFVATNSITQGEQVAQLWPILFDRCKLEIAFAHRTFAWGSDARGKAHVHVVIIGLAKAVSAPKDKRLFSYSDINGEPHESRHSALSPYLFDAGRLSNPHLIVQETGKPMNSFPKLLSGSQPIDNRNYIFNVEQRTEFLAQEPGAAAFLRPYVGSRELINGGQRWILALQNATPAQLRALPKVVERMRAVKAYRLGRNRTSTLAIANYPEKYNVEVIPTAPFLVIPKVSSERREYVPIGWMDAPTIPSDLVFVLKDATKTNFCLLTSAMHMSWLRHIGGKLKSDYRYSIGLVYNTFPAPGIDDKAAQNLEKLADDVLNARATHPGSSFADLYDPDTMPANLRKAHQALDRAVDRLYRPKPFTSDRERVEHLFGLYEKMVAPLTAKPKAKRRRAKKADA